MGRTAGEGFIEVVAYMVTKAAWGWEAGRGMGLPLTPQAYLSKGLLFRCPWDNTEWGYCWLWGLQRDEPSLIGSRLDAMDQGINHFLLGEVSFLSFVPVPALP